MVDVENFERFTSSEAETMPASKRAAVMEQLRAALRASRSEGGSNAGSYASRLAAVRAIERALADTNWEVRFKALQVLNELIDGDRSTSDQYMLSHVLALLVRCVADSKISVRRIALQTLHLYMGYTQSLQMVLYAIARYGLLDEPDGPTRRPPGASERDENADFDRSFDPDFANKSQSTSSSSLPPLSPPEALSMQREWCVALPTLLSGPLRDADFGDVVRALVHKLAQPQLGALHDTVRKVLAHVQNLVGDERFAALIRALPAHLRTFYLKHQQGANSQMPSTSDYVPSTSEAATASDSASVLPTNPAAFNRPNAMNVTSQTSMAQAPPPGRATNPLASIPPNKKAGQNQNLNLNGAGGPPSLYKSIAVTSGSGAAFRDRADSQEQRQSDAAPVNLNLKPKLELSRSQSLPPPERERTRLSQSQFRDHPKAEPFRFGFVPAAVLEQIEYNPPDQSADSEQVVRMHLSGCAELQRVVREASAADVSAAEANGDLLGFLSYLNALVDDANFRVVLLAIDILHTMLAKLVELQRQRSNGKSWKEGSFVVFLRHGVSILLKRLSDNKLVLRQTVFGVLLQLMQEMQSPMPMIETFISLMAFRNRNSRLRQEAMNVVTAALLTWPSTALDLGRVARLSVETLLDAKRQVRLAAFEAIAALAQALGASQKRVLVAAIEEVELQFPDLADGLMSAIQARLARRILPRLHHSSPIGAPTAALDSTPSPASTTSSSSSSSFADIIVEYALQIPSSMQLRQSSQHALGPDLEWILAASSSASTLSSAAASPKPPDSRPAAADQKQVGAAVRVRGLQERAEKPSPADSGLATESTTQRTVSGGPEDLKAETGLGHPTSGELETFIV